MLFVLLIFLLVYKSKVVLACRERISSRNKCSSKKHVILHSIMENELTKMKQDVNNIDCISFELVASIST